MTNEIDILLEKLERLQGEHDKLVEINYKLRIESDRKTEVINMLKKRAISAFEKSIADML